MSNVLNNGVIWKQRFICLHCCLPFSSSFLLCVNLFTGGHTEGNDVDQSVVAGEYVVCTLIAEFTLQVERKVDALLLETEVLFLKFYFKSNQFLSSVHFYKQSIMHSMTSLICSL